MVLNKLFIRFTKFVTTDKRNITLALSLSLCYLLTILLKMLFNRTSCILPHTDRKHNTLLYENHEKPKVKANFFFVMFCPKKILLELFVRLLDCSSVLRLDIVK